MSETRVIVGSNRAQNSRTGAPAPTLGDPKRTYWRVARGRARSLKREEREERKMPGCIPPPVFAISSLSVGRRSPVAEGHALAWTEIACMSWEIPVLGAQDKDVRPDTEESC